MNFRLFIFFLFTVNLVFSQEINQPIKGRVVFKNKPVPYAKISIQNDSILALTDENGYFQIEKMKYGTYQITIKAIGFSNYENTIHFKGKNDSLFVFQLIDNGLKLNEVVVSGSLKEIKISDSPVKIEIIQSSFFKTQNFNSFVDIFQNINGVQEQMNCGVCGTNEIRINGMEGPYTLVLIDGMPIMGGLSSIYGMNGIPTSMIDRVEVIKGPSSTLYGSEAVGGLINIITKKSSNAALFSYETNASTHQEFRQTISFSPVLNKRVQSFLTIDHYYNPLKIDNNDDGFTDFPLNNRLSVFNKWMIYNKKDQELFSIAGRYYAEERFGGQMNWNKNFIQSDSVYGEYVETKRLEVLGSYFFPSQNKNLRLDFSFNQHYQDSYYGDINYKGFNQVLFSNLIWDKIFGRNKFTSGFSQNYQIYSDNSILKMYDETYVPGVYSQYERKQNKDLTLLMGLRMDYHKNHGLIFSPRFSIKKNVKDLTIFRFNYGTGFRRVNLFTEDHAFLTGTRNVIINEQLKPESSHNFTLNANQTYHFLGFGNFDIDVFYTYFSNKIVPDYNTSPDLIIYENLEGYAISRGVSLALSHNFKKGLKMRMGTTFQNVFQMAMNEEGQLEKENQLFVPNFSSIFALVYENKKHKFSLNYSGNLIGKQYLPIYETPFERNEISDFYSLHHFHFLKEVKNWEITLGVKNIFNYSQPSPLIDPQNPYGDNFDTAYIYAPLQTRRFYIGIKYQISKK